MKKLIVVLISVFTLQGCLYQSADNIDIRKAIKYCGGVDKVQELLIYFSGTESVLCSNKTKKKSLRDITLD